MTTTQTPTPATPFPGGGMLTLSCLYVYFVTGIVITGVGPSLPAIGKHFSVSLGSQGFVFIGMFGGACMAVLAGGFLGDIIGHKRIVIIGAALMGLGTALVSSAPRWELVLAGFLLIGWGLGFLDVSTNAVVAHVNAASSARHLAFLHAGFGVGAVSGPSLAAAFLVSTGSFRAVFALSAVLSVLACAWFLPQRFPPPCMSDGFDIKTLRRVFLDPRFVVLAALMFISTGVEMSLNGWTFTFLHRENGASVALASAGTSLFWGGLLAGRMLAGAVALRVGPARLLFVNLSGMALALAGVVLMRSPAAVVVMTALAGFFISSQVPLIISLGADASGDARGAVTGSLFALGSFGSALLPAAVARIAEHASLRGGLAALLPLAALAAPLLFWLRFRNPRAR